MANSVKLQYQSLSVNTLVQPPFQREQQNTRYVWNENWCVDGTRTYSVTSSRAESVRTCQTEWRYESWSRNRQSEETTHCYSSDIPRTYMQTAVCTKFTPRAKLQTNTTNNPSHRDQTLLLIRSNKMQQYAYLFTANLLYMFRVSIAPIIRST